jgi:hypothetical protein
MHRYVLCTDSTVLARFLQESLVSTFAYFVGAVVQVWSRHYAQLALRFDVANLLEYCIEQLLHRKSDQW